MRRQMITGLIAAALMLCAGSAFSATRTTPDKKTLASRIAGIWRVDSIVNKHDKLIRLPKSFEMRVNFHPDNSCSISLSNLRHKRPTQLKSLAGNWSIDGNTMTFGCFNSKSSVGKKKQIKMRIRFSGSKLIMFHKTQGVVTLVRAE